MMDMERSATIAAWLNSLHLPSRGFELLPVIQTNRVACAAWQKYSGTMLAGCSCRSSPAPPAARARPATSESHHCGTTGFVHARGANSVHARAPSPLSARQSVHHNGMHQPWSAQPPSLAPNRTLIRRSRRQASGKNVEIVRVRVFVM